MVFSGAKGSGIGSIDVSLGSGVLCSLVFGYLGWGVDVCRV
jgi:hypothetical protein